MSISRTYFFDEVRNHLEDSVNKITKPENAENFNENISELSGFQYIERLNLSILSGEYYFVDKSTIRTLKSYLKELFDYVSVFTEEKDKNAKKNIIELSSFITPLLDQFSKLLDYTKMKDNRKTVKPVYKIENIIEKTKTDDYLFQLNILLAEIDHDLHVSEEIEEKLILIKNSLENKRSEEGPERNNQILLILLDKTNLLLYKIYSRKIKTFKKKIGEKYLYSNDLRDLEQKIESLKKDVEINNRYSKFL